MSEFNRSICTVAREHLPARCERRRPVAAARCSREMVAPDVARLLIQIRFALFGLWTSQRASEREQLFLSVFVCFKICGPKNTRRRRRWMATIKKVRRPAAGSSRKQFSGRQSSKQSATDRDMNELAEARANHGIVMAATLMESSECPAGGADLARPRPAGHSAMRPAVVCHLVMARAERRRLAPIRRP